MSMSADLGRVYAEQIRSSYGHLPLTLSVAVLNSVLLGLVLSSAVAEVKLLAWIGSVASLAAIRLGVWYAYHRHASGPALNRFWALFATAGALASGVLWGISIYLFAPLGESYQLFLALVISGMCAGAATVHAAHFPSVIAFIVPAIVPLALNFFGQGDRLHVVAGVMAGIFGISLCIASLKFRGWFRTTTSARLSLARQTLELNAANARLKEEIERHQSTELKLQHAQKMEAIGRLTAGVAHDFNNLLMAVGGAAELLSSHVGPESADRRLVENILQTTERGTSLTRQLLVYGRKQTLLPRLVDINDMLRGMEELLASTLGGYGKLMLQLDQTIPQMVLVDVDQLETSILNLVINAGDAMPEGGCLTITTGGVELDGSEAEAEGMVGKFVMISVADSGVGMTEAVRLRAFDPFFTTKGPGRGSGLGLSQVYGLVQQSGGIVNLKSRPGEGTTVVILLPRVAHTSAVPPERPIRSPTAGVAATDAVPPHRARRILLLDDDEQVLETLTEMLTDSGYTVAPYASAAPALEELDRPRRIDLIIADLAMPTVRGDQFAAAVRLRRSDIPILFITGYAETDALQGERSVLRKPFKLTALIAAVEGAILADEDDNRVSDDRFDPREADSTGCA